MTAGPGARDPQLTGGPVDPEDAPVPAPADAPELSAPPADEVGGRRPAVTVHLLRHGEVHNPEGVLYGRLPGYRLSDEGHAMAKKAAEWFADKDVVQLISSPLERAR